MNIFISGGCKNGKSYFAQRVAQDLSREKAVPLYYLATMRPVDDEDRARIRRHIGEREGWGFETVEQSENILKALERADSAGVFLLDSVTALLSNEMFRADGSVDLEAPERIAEELTEFAKRTGSTVFVSDYIYSDAMLYDELTEAYRKGLAHIDKALRRCCEEVNEVSFSNINRLKTAGK